jgi:asparagine synthase (glutamine-hydrolysing)
MLSEDGALAIAYNGEIYNYRDLRAELIGRGHHFRTHSDTEVVLAAYQEFGSGFPNHLRGMFAVAIWDRPRRRLLLARDRLGIKPLFFHVGDRRIVFASELKALLLLPEVSRSWDSQALFDYFHFLYVPVPRTAYRDIQQVPPATCVSIGEDGIKEERYWELQPGERLRGTEGVHRVAEVLEDAVREHLVSDVPIGAFLSGGIDSGLVVGLMSRALEEPIRTFTVYDPNSPFYDERERAGLVAKAFATDHQELVAAGETQELADMIVPTFDEPFADSGTLANLVVCRETSREVKVALSGLGGDEISAGYMRYAGASIGRAGRLFPAPLRRALTAAVDLLPEGRGLGIDRTKRLVRLIGQGDAEFYGNLVTAGTRLTQPILSSEFSKDAELSAPVDEIARHLQRADELGLDAVNRLLYVDLHTYVPGDLLPLADRTSMLFGLEVRVPFLDHRLVETALGVPGNEKLRFGRTKILLRRIAQDLLPSEVLSGPKRGFSVPMAEWLRGPLSDEMTRAVENTAPATGLMSREGLREAWSQHRSGRVNHEDILWATLVFSRWAESS